jgi:hypothetical protein
MKTRAISMCVALAAALTGASCSEVGEPEVTSAESEGEASQAFTKSVDLISPTNCPLKNGKLANCVIKTEKITGAVSETAVPLRTTIKRTVKGNCSIKAWDLGVRFTSSGVPTPPTYRYMDLSTTSNNQIQLRRKGGAAISSITMTDVGINTAVALFPSDCRVSLTVVANEVDVDSSEDAEAIMAELNADLQKKINLRESYEHLVKFGGAFEFLREVADSFRVELTNETIQELRKKAESTVGSIALLSSACDDMMNDEDRENMMLLMLGLPQLGSPADWSHPDGSPKTLEEFMGAESGAIYATVDKLVKAHALSNGQTYDELYKQAAEDAARAEAKVALAAAQLKAWL